MENREGTFPKYSDIELIHKVKDTMLLASSVQVTEKLDGTNVRFGLVDGIFYVGGRNLVFGEGAQVSLMGFEQLAPSLEEAMRKASLEGYIFYGEWYGKGIQKGIIYGDQKYLAVFDVKKDGQWLPWEDIITACEHIGVRPVPLLYKGAPSFEKFDGLMKRDSIQAKQNGVEKTPNLMEGIVIRAVPDLFDVYGHRILAKYKNEAFSEVKPHSPAGASPEQRAEVEAAEAFVGAYVTKERMRHVLSYLREAGKDVRALTIMPDLIRGMIEDLRKEAPEEMASLGEAGTRFLGKRLPSQLRVWLQEEWKDETNSPS